MSSSATLDMIELHVEKAQHALRQGKLDELVDLLYQIERDVNALKREVFLSNRPSGVGKVPPCAAHAFEPE